MKQYPDRIDSKFRFVLLAAKRAEQLLQGAVPRVPVDDLKTTRIALKEIREDKVSWDYGPAPVVEAVETAEAAEPAAEAAPEGEAEAKS